MSNWWRVVQEDGWLVYASLSPFTFCFSIYYYYFNLAMKDVPAIRASYILHLVSVVLSNT